MHKPSRLVLLAASVAAVGTLTIGSPALADPPGNNATIKIDGVAFDTAPNNEPHVGCRFQLDFYGYDQGNYNADVVFSVQPPTGKFVPILTDTVFVGEDAAGGGTDLDAEVQYNLTQALKGYAPHPQQGFHVKVEVNAPASNGATNKFKVFWVEGCYPGGGGGGYDT